MTSWSLQAELADIHARLDKLQAGRRRATTHEIEQLRARLVEIERHLGITRIIS